MRKKIALFFSVFALLYANLAFSGAVGPFVGKLSSTGSMAYYASNSYSKAQAAMGVGNRWNPDLLASSGLGVNVTQKIALPVGAGVANTTLSGLITPANVLSVAGTILGGPVGIGLTGLFVLPAIVDWLLSADARPAAPGSPKNYEIKDSTVCTVAPCYEYQGLYNTWSEWGPANQTCSWLGAQKKLANPSWTYAGSSVSGTHCYVTGNMPGYSVSTEDIHLYSRQIAPLSSSTAWKPANYSDFSQKLSGVPVSTALINSLLDAGYTFPLDGQTVTGPSSVTGPSTTSVTNSTSNAGDSITTTTVSTPVTNITYNTTTNPDTGKPAPTVSTSTTTTTTTTITNNTTNTTNTTTTINQKPDSDLSIKPVDPVDLCVAHPEVMACAKPDDLDNCKKNPDTVGCMKPDQPDVPDLEKIEKPISFTPDGGWGGGGGSCPAPRPLTSVPGAVFTFQPYCDFMTGIRAVMIGAAWFVGAMILVGANRRE